jgi:ABC-type methionine transport system ATPase subunit
MKQRIAIARGILNDPAVLFMDELTRASIRVQPRV